MSNLLAESQQLFASIPQCAKQTVFQAVGDSGCGFNIQCLCTETTFFAQLQEQLPHICSLDQIGGSFSEVSKLCLEAVPSLSESRESTVLGSIIAMLILATLAVVLRLIARRVSAMMFGIDDLLIILALVTAYGNDIILLVAVRFGYGKHAILSSPQDLLSFAKTTWANQLFFVCSVTFTKLSILFFYRRLFTSKTFTRFCICTGVFVILWLISAIFGIVFSCVPLTYFWDKSIKTGGRCFNQYAFTHSLTALNIFTDVTVLLLPIPCLWKLQISPARKLAIVGIFLLGGFVCVAAIVRIFFINRVHWSDATYTFVDLGIWLNVECNIGIVSACLPILPPLVKYVTPLLKKLRRSILLSTASIDSQGSLTSAGSERPDVEGEKDGGQERMDQRTTGQNGERKMGSFELRAQKVSSFSGTGKDDEARNVHLPD